jgi:hypothetical protein
MIQFATYDALTGALIADYTSRVESASFVCNEHGFASAKASIPLDIYDSFYQYNRPGLVHVAFNENGEALWEGRLEDPAITIDSLEAAVMGYQRSLFDTKHTALWSTTDSDKWEILDNDTFGITGTAKDKYSGDTKGRIYASLQHNTTYTNNSDYMIFGFYRPDQSNRLINGVSFDYDVNLPANWSFVFQTRNDDMTLISNVITITSSGIAKAGTINTTFAGAGVLCMLIYNGTGANYTDAAENGIYYIDITNIRVVTTTANRVSTVLGASGPTIPNGVQTVTPVSMANIYVGQRLQIASNTPLGESVIVTAITASTFTATFASPHPVTDTVASHVVYANEIVSDLVSGIVAVNPGALSSNKSLIQSPKKDITDELYEDQRPADILKSLVESGDDQTPSRIWTWQVWEDKILEFKPVGYNNRTWNVIIADISLNRRLDDIYNSYYPIYKDSNGKTIRGAASTDQASVNKYGITRVDSVSVNTKIAAIANITRDTLLNYNKDPRPSIKITFDVILDQNGSPAQLTDPRPGDTLVLQNLPTDLGSVLDFIRSVTIGQTAYNPIDDELQLESDVPYPSITFLLSQALK